MRNGNGLAALAFVALAVAAAPAWAADSDSDGLSDSFETLYGTNVNNADSDGDNLTDFAEVFQWGTSPVQQDTDADGIRDDLDPTMLDNGTYTGPTLVAGGWSDTNPYAGSGESPRDGYGVYVHNGLFEYSFTVAQTKGVGLPGGVTFTIRSQNAGSGSAGKGVFWIGDAWLEEQGNGDVKILDDGVVRTYVYDPVTGTYASPSGCSCSLSTLGKVSASVFERSFPTVAGSGGCGTCCGTPGVHKITYTDGVVTKAEDLFGNKIEYSYNGQQQLVTLNDTRGLDTTFEYYSTGYLESITTPDAAKWTLKYNPFGQLMYLDGPVTPTFEYGIRTE